MLKNISNLKGAQTLTRDEQKTINGGIFNCKVLVCEIGFCCSSLVGCWDCRPA